MKLPVNYKLICAAAMGMAFAALTAQAQLNINLTEKATFDPFTGGVPNAVTNNGTFDTQEVITTGTGTVTPFKLTYTPLPGASLLADFETLNVATLNFKSSLGATDYFTSLGAKLEFDFDHDGNIDLTQTYTISLSSIIQNQIKGIHYSIVPNEYFGSVTINGAAYNFASAVAGSSGTLFGTNDATALFQFAFVASPVPEPSTYALFGVAALGGVTWLRRRRSQQVVAA